MARLNPEIGFSVLKDKVIAATKDVFPIVGNDRTLELHDVAIPGEIDLDDLRGQKETKLQGRSWTVPVHATLALKDNRTGDVVEKKKVKLMDIPKPTSRLSYIIDGKEYQVDNQWRLKPGAYSMIKDDGSLETHFNTAGVKGRDFKLHFDPESKKFQLEYDGKHVPLAPVLQGLGVPPETIEGHWGPEIFAANKADPVKVLTKFHEIATGQKAPSLEQAHVVLKDTFENTGSRADVNEITLGHPYTNANGDAIMAAANKLLGISQGKVKPDPRDSLMFKDLHSVEDFVGERIQAGAKEITRKVKNTIDRRDKGIRDIVAPDVFNKSVRSLFTGGSGLAGTPTQHNPLEMLSNQMKTTVMGKGGIHDFHVVSEDAKLVDPSHMGFMDPLHTSEGQDVGIGLRLPVGIGKRGHDVTMRVYDMKTGKSKEITPKEAMFSKVVLPDQVKWEKGKPVPVGAHISMSGVGNEIVSAPIHEADYVMLDPIQLFSTSTNMIPFMPADHPNRTTMAGRHMEQAISLKNRAAPLVQSMAGNISFEKMVGSYASHVANVDGTVHKIKKDAIVVEDAAGKKHEIQTYDNFPLNTDRVFIHSDPIVKVGDKVKKGQVVADTNYTKDGHLALGTNLRVAYMPYKGYNFEDGVVISETAAQKLSSEHLYRNELERDNTHVLDKKKYRAYVPMSLTKEQADKLDDDGVVHKGQIVMPGDTLIAALRQKGEAERREDADLAKLHKSIVTPYKDASVKWDADHPGVVEEVSKTGRNVAVHVKTLQPMEVGDKLAGRHGNKGIVTKIVPDHEMPVTKDGRPTEVLLNPAGVPGRTNLGQLLEVSAGKIAEKTGKTYYVKNFEPGVDLHQKVTDELKAHGLPDKEDVVDPTTGRVMGQALVGPQHIVKLVHQVDKKMIARAGGPGYTYDSSMVPKGGGPHGAQSLGALGLYAMLAHGAVHNLREMYTLKSDAAQNDQFWHAIQAGEALPAPRPTFSYNKFVSYLKAIGINVKKEGNNLTLVPLTDKHVLEMSNGEIKNPAKWVRAKNMAPEKDGLFDPRLTGGMSGTQWTHMTLPEPFPNPVFEDPTPNQRGAIRTLLGLKGNSYDDLVAGRIAVDKDGKVVSTDTPGALVGGKAVHHLLSKIDVKTELAQAKLDIEKPNLKGAKLDEVNKKIKFLTALQTAGLTPPQAYMMHHVPIIPPVMRPLSVSDGNRISEDDLNGLYKYVHLSAQKYKEMSPLIPDDDEAKVALREEIHDGLRALTGIGGYPSQVRRGVLDIIAGKRVVNRQTGEKSGSPKEGFFQDKLVSRKQDLTMRSTIVPEPSLGLDEVGIPKPAALELYKPFVIKELRKLQDITPLQARAQIEKGGGMVDRALERVVSERPILIKRDPVLHKYSIQAFKPRVVSGRTIQIHPLVTSGFNADFDGDAMGAFVPVSSQAVEEAKRMMPSHNLFNPSTGKIMYAPTHEMKLGLYGVTKDGQITDKTYKDIHEVEAAVRKGDAKLNDVVTVSGIKASVGRFLVAGALPDVMRKELLTSKTPLNGKAQDALLDRLAREHKHEYGTIVNRLKDLGNQWATQNAFSLGLSDVAPDRALRDKILAAADAEAKKATGAKKDDHVIAAYTKATEQMHAHLSGLTDEHSNLISMHHAGVKPAMDTLRQIKMAPMLVMDAKGRTIPTPIRKSYAEGLDVSGYWTSTSGARKGAIQKVQSVSDPGYTSKMVMNTTMNTLVKDHDCGTDKGISLDVDEKDILDRFTAAPIKVGAKTIPAGTLITPEVKNTLRNNKIGKVVVRSPLRCLHGPGICQKCFGLDSDGNLPPVGTNIGVLAGQALGERSVQLAMKAFHCNHADSLVLIRDSAGRVRMPTLEDLYDAVPGEVVFDGNEEVKQVRGLQIWDGRWVRLTHVRRHRPTRPMKMVGDGHLVTICQDNHPIGVWENIGKCSSCGYHRLKKTRASYVCPRCGVKNVAPTNNVGAPSFAPPSEMERGSHYLQHDLSRLKECKGASIGYDPYFIGAYLAEGCVVWKRSHKFQKEKQPYQIQISQKDGKVRKKIKQSMKDLKPKDRSRYLAVDSVELGRCFSELFGRYSRNKALPPDFINYHPDWTRKMLAGLIDGDGTIKHNVDGPDSISIDTTSFALAQQVVMICYQLGIVAGIVATSKRELTRHQGFQVRLRMTTAAKELLSESLKVRDLKGVSPDQVPSDKGYRLISNVRSVLYTHEYVYDATTETGTLFVGGLKHHNTGGSAASKAELTDDFKQVSNLLSVPKTLPGSATLSTITGKVDDVRKDPAGGHDVVIDGKRHYVPHSRGLPMYEGVPIKKGMEVRKGAAISGGPINPHELLDLAGIEHTQGHIAGALYDLYKGEGIRRRNAEVVVKAATNLTEVLHPGSSTEFIRGDYAPTSKVQAYNRSLPKGHAPIVHKPLLKGVEMMPLEMQEDWLAQLNHMRLHETVINAAQRGWTSAIHGPHPIPAIAYAAEFGHGKPGEY